MAGEHVWRRVTAAQALLAERNVDALVLLLQEGVNWESVYYLSGFRGTSGALLVTGDDAVLVTDGRYLAQARRQSPFSLVPQEGQGLLDVLGDLLRRRHLKSVGFEGDKVSFATYRRLADMGVWWEDVSDLLPRLRRRKDVQERRLIEEAAKRASFAFLEMLKRLEPGMTERRVAALLEFLLREAGADGGWGTMDFIVASGPRSALPHGRPTDRSMERGEWVTVDFGARYEGYVCDITRTISLGEADPWVRNMHALILEAQTRGSAALRTGAAVREVDEAARNVIVSAGMGECFSHGLGHGIGLSVHEAPRLSFRSEEILEAGDVVTVEPGVYLEGRGGVRVEDNYLMEENGAVCLTEYLPRELFVI